MASLLASLKLKLLALIADWAEIGEHPVRRLGSFGFCGADDGLTQPDRDSAF